MSEYYIELQNVDIDGDGDVDKIQYHFKLIQNLDDQGEIPFTTIEGNDTLQNNALGFEGKTRSLPISWIIYDNGNDKSNGTWDNKVGSSYDSRLGSNIESIEDQLTYLNRYIQNSALGSRWRLFGGRFTDPDGSGNDNGTPVAVENLNTTRSSSNINRASGVIRLKVANVV